MRFSIQREVLLKPLQQVINVVERKQTMPVLGNLLTVIDADGLQLTGSDSEVEMIARAAVADDAVPGEITIPARKLFDITRALPDGSLMKFSLSGDRLGIQAGRSRFTLATLPASDFPSTESLDVVDKLQVSESVLRDLIEQSAFAMAVQDVRFFLNGLLFDINEKRLRCVATDGHRMAMSETVFDTGVNAARQMILPRKGVLELQRLLESGDRTITLELGRSHLRVSRDDVTFTSKLIDGRFPDYETVIPIGADLDAKIDRETLKAALQRAAILSNEKYRGVRFDFSPGQLRVMAHNPEQEEANEEIEANTSIDGISIGFNVMYLLDAINALRSESILFSLRDANSSALIREDANGLSKHVIMPMRI